jgi:hypothetical protein
VPAVTSSITDGMTVTQGASWTLTTDSSVKLVEFWADGTNIAEDATAPFSTTIALTVGSHKLGMCVTTTTRYCLGSGGVFATISVQAAPPPAPTNLAPNPSFNVSPGTWYVTHGSGSFSWASDRARSGRSLKIASSKWALSRWLSKTTLIRADAGRRYSASVWVYGSKMQGSAKLALTFWNKAGSWLGVAEESSAVGTTSDWRQVSVSRTAPSGTAFVRIEFRHTGVGTTWWDDVSLTSGTGSLSGAAAASPASVSTAGSFRWDGRSFRTARTLRLHLERRSVDWDRFLAKRPAVASAFGLRPVAWDGRRFFSRPGLRRQLGRNHAGLAGWAARHPEAARILFENAVAETVAYSSTRS